MNSGFYLAIGKQGTGKTVMITKLLVDELEKNDNRKIYSNYTLYDINYIPIVRMKNPNKTYKKNTLSFLQELIKDADQFNNSIILIDEIHLYFDSLDFMKKHNRLAQTFFSQLRKRNTLLLGTSQYIMNVDIRLRRQCKNVFDMANIYKDLFEVVTCEIDGYFQNEISRYNIRLNDYFKYYDTNEIITE